LYYSKDKDPDPIIDRALNRLAKIYYEKAKDDKDNPYYGKSIKTIKEILIDNWVDKNTGKLILAKYGE